MESLHRFTRKLAIRNRAIRELLAEFLGTFILVTFAVGAGSQLTLGGTGTAQITAHLAGGMGVMLAITVSGGVSGGGVNPAVSLAFCLTNRTPWILYPVHVIGQLIGAFVAAGLMFCVYEDAIDAYDKGNRSVGGPTGTAAMFTSFPQDYLSTKAGFLDQVVGTGMLILCIHAIIDKYNMDAPKGVKPLLVGLCVFAIGGTMGLNCGYPINPARDLGPRLFLLVAGWGKEVFSYNDYNWFWVPIVGPLTGSLVGTLMYYMFVGWHWKDDQRGLEYNLEDDDRPPISAHDTKPTISKMFHSTSAMFNSHSSNYTNNGGGSSGSGGGSGGVTNLGFTPVGNVNAPSRARPV